MKWGWSVDQGKNVGIVRILSITLRLSGALLGAPLPPSVSSRLLGDPVSLGLADEIRMRIISRNSLHPESLAYFSLMMRLRERKVDRLKFLQSLALTPGPNEWKVFRIPNPLFPMNRLSQISLPTYILP